MPLTLLSFPRPLQLPAEAKLAYVRSELVSELEDQLEQLREQAVVVHARMAQMLARIAADGFYAEVSDLAVGEYEVIRARVALLQEQLAVIESVDD